MAKPVIIGTRGSKLALWQAEWLRSALLQRFSGISVEVSVIKTQGDKILDVPLAKVGGKGLFVKEIEEALRAGRVDVAVHSMKDMPAEIPAGLAIGAVPEREIPTDVLISRNGLTLMDIPAGGVIGTSSLRRAAQLRHVRPDLEIFPLRGNVETRIRKLETDQLAAVVLAAAGVKRLGLEHRITEHLADRMLPAVGQGALCLEIRAEDPRIGPMVSTLDHPATRTAVSGERAFLMRLEGGCQVPIAGYGRIEGSHFTLTGLVAAVDGSAVIKHSLSGPAAFAERIGVELAEILLSRGADIILKKLTSTAP
jgi:hydroxymethylbilane synthase